jgi:hypothetical protein
MCKITKKIVKLKISRNTRRNDRCEIHKRRMKL